MKGLFPELKQTGRGTEKLLSFSAAIKNVWDYTSYTSPVSLHTGYKQNNASL